MENTNKVQHSIFTVKNILRALEVFLIVFVFCPSFLVSCSGQTVNVSAMNAAVGMKSDTLGQISEAKPVMLICLILPILMLVIICAKKMIDNKAALLIILCAAIDFVVWLIFRESVKKYAEDNYCSFKTTGWFVFNIIVLVIIILISIAVAVDKLKMDSDLINATTGSGTQDALNQMSNAVTQMSSAVTQMAGNVASNIKTSKVPVIGYCQKCGAGIPFDNRFCTSCGNPVPEDLIAEAEAKKKAEEEAEAARIAAEEAARKETEEKARIAAEEAARKEAEEKAKNESEEENTTEKGLSDQEGEQIENDRPMFCQQCGAKLDPDALFCMTCGTKVE